MDSLRYWVTEMHVDGFRFDLASTLARELFAVDRLSAFFDLVQQDPVVSSVKLIAEPWDVGEGGYQVGNFPPLWSEWNGRYRDTIRDFWRGEPAALAEFGFRFTGSSDLYQDDSRRPDGVDQLRHRPRRVHARRPRRPTTTSTTRPTARATATASRTTARGTAASRGRPTTRRSLALRQRQRRNLMTTLLLSQGVPMILGGDELGRTQGGNNNAYCQDGADLVVRLGARRPRVPRVVPAADRPAPGPPGVPPPAVVPAPSPSGAPTEIAWLRPDGQPMSDSDWDNGYAKAVGVLLDGEAISTPDRFGGRVVDDTFYVMLNASELDLPWALPSKSASGGHATAIPWTVQLDTSLTHAAGVGGARRRHR